MDIKNEMLENLKNLRCKLKYLCVLMGDIQFTYIAYNKPVGIVCTTEKTEGNIIDELKFPEKILPVGRLDKDSEGLILLTNDKSSIHKIIHPDFEHEKEYLVTLNLPIRNQFLKQMEAGLDIGDAVTLPCSIKPEPGTRRVFRIIIKQGLNRQIRRMCNVYGYQVLKLKRVRIMHIKLGDLKSGEWRYLTTVEIQQIYNRLKNK